MEKFIKQNTNNLEATYYPKSELVIARDYLKGGKNLLLAWKFSISSLKPNNEQLVFVNANTGEIINQTPEILDANTPLTAQTKYSGTLGITGDSYTGGFRLKENRNGVNVETLNIQNGSNYANTIEFSNNNTNFTNGSWGAFAQDQQALDAHWAEEKVLDFWKTVFNRNSLNGSGIQVVGYAHYNDPYSSDGWPNNAQWDGSNHVMRYGDGDGIIFNPFTALDVCAHEMGHGIDEFTANLTPGTQESGALNEGFSDIWGASIEHWVAPTKQTWLIGEEIFKPGTHDCIRNLQNPEDPNASEGLHPNTYQHGNWDPYGDPHTNSTVLSHWYYLLSQGGCGTNDIPNTFYVHGIGITDAEKIAWRTESQYLTSSANYAAVSAASIQAAKDLFGINSTQVHSVTNAWYAVGIGSTQIQPSVSGADYFCSGSSTYTIADLPTGSTVTYSISQSGSIASLSQANNQATLTKTGIGIVTLYATISTTCGTQIAISKNAYVGRTPPVNFSITKPWCDGNTQTWDITTTPASYGSNWHWTVDYLGNNAQIYIYYPYFASTDVDVTGGGTIKLTYTDACGTTETNGLTVYSTCNSGYNATKFTVAPNPARNDIMVSAVANTNLINAKTKSISAPNLIYGIKITDVSGILRKSFEYKAGIRSIKISVAGLNAGVYSLSVFDGKQWQSQNIIVQK